MRHLGELTGSLPGRRIDSLVIAVDLRNLMSSEDDGVKEYHACSALLEAIPPVRCQALVLRRRVYNIGSYA